MVVIEFLGPINKENMSLEIKNLSELSEILKDDEKVSSWLETCAVAVNDTLISSKDITLNDGDKVSLLPPVCGGWNQWIIEKTFYNYSREVYQ